MQKVKIPCKCFLTLLVLVIPLFRATAQVAVLKAELHNHQLWIKARLNGAPTDTLNLVFDSGAGSSLLDSSVVARIFPGRRLGQSMAKGASGTTTMQVLGNESIYLGGQKLDGINFLVNNLNRLSGTMGRRLDGIIGYDILKRFVVRLDLDKQTLALYQHIDDVKEDKGPALDFDFSPDINFLPRIKGSFTTQNNKVYSGYFFFDSGAGLACLLNTPFVDDNNLLSESGPVLHMRADGLTNTTDRITARARSFSIGGYTFNDVPLGMSKTAAGVSAMKGYAGLVGNEILYKYNITFDYAHKAIYMQPNRSHDAAFQFPMAAFAFKTDGAGVYVSNVAPDSPEEQLGLKQGDRLLSINGKANLDLDRARAFLARKGNIKLKVRRDNTEKEFNINLYPRI